MPFVMDDLKPSKASDAPRCEPDAHSSPTSEGVPQMTTTQNESVLGPIARHERFRAELYESISHTSTRRGAGVELGDPGLGLPDPVTGSTESVLRVHYHRRMPDAPGGVTYQVVLEAQ